MIQADFAHNARMILAQDSQVAGLAAGGSWITGEMDEFSDLDLIIVTQTRISGDKDRMTGYAERLGTLLSGFTGEHVGEPRLLICLYGDPLLHVDLKFLTPEEFGRRIETPAILFDRDGQLQAAMDRSQAVFPWPGYQWIEDRFWTWAHYALLKIGRGEFLEALDFSGFLRMTVLGPLLHIKNGNLPRGVRRVETMLPEHDLVSLQQTIPACNRQSLLRSLRNAVALYRGLRTLLFGDDVIFQQAAEEAVMTFFDQLQQA